MKRAFAIFWWFVFFTTVLDVGMIGLPLLPKRTKALLLGCVIAKAAWCHLRMERP
jgi:hypothetical protein